MISLLLSVWSALNFPATSTVPSWWHGQAAGTTLLPVVRPAGLLEARGLLFAAYVKPSMLTTSAPCVYRRLRVGGWTIQPLRYHCASRVLWPTPKELISTCDLTDGSFGARSAEHGFGIPASGGTRVYIGGSDPKHLCVAIGFQLCGAGLRGAGALPHPPLVAAQCMRRALTCPVGTPLCRCTCGTCVIRGDLPAGVPVACSCGLAVGHGMPNGRTSGRSPSRRPRGTDNHASARGSQSAGGGSQQQRGNQRARSDGPSGDNRGHGGPSHWSGADSGAPSGYWAGGSGNGSTGSNTFVQESPPWAYNAYKKWRGKAEELEAEKKALDLNKKKDDDESSLTSRLTGMVSSRLAAAGFGMPSFPSLPNMPSLPGMPGAAPAAPVAGVLGEHGLGNGLGLGPHAPPVPGHPGLGLPPPHLFGNQHQFGVPSALGQLQALPPQGFQPTIPFPSWSTAGQQPLFPANYQNPLMYQQSGFRPLIFSPEGPNMPPVIRATDVAKRLITGEPLPAQQDGPRAGGGPGAAAAAPPEVARPIESEGFDRLAAMMKQFMSPPEKKRRLSSSSKSKASRPRSPSASSGSSGPRFPNKGQKIHDERRRSGPASRSPPRRREASPSVPRLPFLRGAPGDPAHGIAAAAAALTASSIAAASAASGAAFGASPGTPGAGSAAAGVVALIAGAAAPVPGNRSSPFAAGLSATAVTTNQWHDATQALKLSLGVLVQDGEPDVTDNPSSNTWADWFSAHVNMVALNKLSMDNAVPLRFESKKLKIQRMIQFAIDSYQ